jgi:putative DNA primase/helicase
VTAPFQPQSPAAVHANVQLALSHLFGHPERPRLVFHRGDFYRWRDNHWALVHRDTLHSAVYRLFEDMWYPDNQGNMMPFNISMQKAKALVDGLQNKTLIDHGIDVPAWFDRDNTDIVTTPPGLPAAEMIACGNVLVHSRSRQTFQHTPRFFNHVAVPYAFDAAAPQPRAWLDFLNDIWADDAESIDTLQEIAGYLLTARTDLQKFFMLIGPPRSGKGTIVRVLTALLGGDSAVASISLANLNEKFGLAELEAKQLAVMQDARFRSRDDGVAVERILSITGEDPVSVEKKNKDQFTMRLSTRFLLVSNELPKMADESGALRSRVVMLRMMRTVDEARRDIHLTDRLLAELPSILNWALDGLDRLNRRGRLVQPKSSEHHLNLLAMLSSPKQAFVDELCRVDTNERIPKQLLFDVWKFWCGRTGQLPGNMVHFARDLYAAVPGVDDARLSVNGKKIQHFTGLGLNTEGQAIADTISWTRQQGI